MAQSIASSSTVVALVFQRRSRIGVAVYDPLDAVLEVGCVSVTNDDLDETLEQIKAQSQARLVLVPSKLISDSAVFDAVKREPALLSARLELGQKEEEEDSDVDMDGADDSNAASSSSTSAWSGAKLLPASAFDLNGAQRRMAALAEACLTFQSPTKVRPIIKQTTPPELHPGS